MTILALDTSSRAASCALWRDGSLAGEFFANTGLTHSRTAMPMVEAMLSVCGASISDVEAFAVSAGPGSFTGLRIGISAVKGMALGRPCAAVSTLEGLAENLTAFRGIILPVMDARRSQVYTAVFKVENGAVVRLGKDEALDIPALGERIAAFAPEPVMLVGDGALKCMELLPEYPHLSSAPASLLHQRAGSVAAIAARMAENGRLCSEAELAPSYLRLPQAERERLAQLTIDN